MTDAKKRLDRFWDKSRDYYEQAAAANPEISPERRHLLEYLSQVEPPSGEGLLVDLGCGSCENALWLPAGWRYLGCDVSTTALAMAHEAGRPGWRVRADGGRVPLASGCADVVLSTWALEHFHEPGRTLLEASRILRPPGDDSSGGLLLLVGSAWDVPWAMPPSVDPRRRFEITVRRLGRQLASTLDRRHRFDVVAEPRVLTEGYVPDADAVHVAQSVLLTRFLEAAGMEIVEHATLPHRPDPPGVRGLLRRLLRRLPLWRHAWGNTLAVARRSGEMREPGYRVLPL